ncbi:hypothetical protein AA0X95_03765 [Bacillus sp. 1P10SD]
MEHNPKLSNRSMDDILVPEAYQDWYFTQYFKANLQKVYELIQS